MNGKFLTACQFAIFSLLFAGVIPIPIPLGMFDALVYYLEKRIWKFLVAGEALINAKTSYIGYQGSATLFGKLHSLNGIPVWLLLLTSLYGYMILTSLSFITTNYILVRVINWYFRRKVPQLKAIVK